MAQAGQVSWSTTMKDAMGKANSRTTPTARSNATAHRAANAAVVPIRVLLLSDLPIVVLGLERLIESGRPAMTLLGTALNVAEALRSMKDAPPDVVLCDLDGEVDGQGITELIDGGRTRVLALTTSRDPEFCDAVVLAGASGVINKRDAASALLKAIEKVHAGEFWLDRVATGRLFVAIARQRTAKDPEQGKIALLTRKERLTVSEIARDASATSREIARRLCISDHTLRNHLTSIYSKLGLRSRMELYAYATKHRLVAAAGVRQASLAGSDGNASDGTTKGRRASGRNEKPDSGAAVPN